MKALFQHHLLHFLVVGAVLAFVFPAKPTNSFVVKKQHLDALSDAQAKRLGVSVLTKRQKQEVFQRYVWDELFAREARRLGLEKDDYIIKQRLVQKMRFLVLQKVRQRVPSTKELRGLFLEQGHRFMSPPRYTFFHLYKQKKQGLLELRQQAVTHDRQFPKKLPNLGENFVVSRHVSDVSAKAIKSMFGQGFVKKLRSLPVGKWSQPIHSKYGWHLVKVVSFRPKQKMTFQEAYKQLFLLVQKAREEKALRDFARRLYKRYNVRFEDGTRDALSSKG